MGMVQQGNLPIILFTVNSNPTRLFVLLKLIRAFCCIHVLFKIMVHIYFLKNRLWTMRIEGILGVRICYSQ